jgi:glycosyltransferase involved in cell wall biosynthesis
VVASTFGIHKAVRTFEKAVDVFISLSEFTKSKYVQAGFPADRIRIKPNFLDPDPGIGAGTGDFVLFFGRLSPEKGVSTLLKAWEILESPIPLKISGAGPLEDEVRSAADRIEGIEYLGFAPDPVIDELLRADRFLVLPSVNYEGFPKIVVESLARGTPVVAARLGAMSELIKEGHNGCLFRPGDPLDLANTVTELYENAPLLKSMRTAARNDYEDLYQASRNCELLTDIYREAIDLRRASSRGES